MENSVTEKVVPVVIGEGRVVRIDLALDGCEAGLLFEEDPESPVVVTFKDPKTGYYVNIFDHRVKSREAFRSDDDEAFEEAFYATPCLVGFRLKGKTQYFAINDIGTPDMRDGGDGEGLVLTSISAIKFDPRTYQWYRLITWKNPKSGKLHPVMHPSTKICLVEPRPEKSAGLLESD